MIDVARYSTAHMVQLIVLAVAVAHSKVALILYCHLDRSRFCQVTTEAPEVVPVVVVAVDWRH